MRHIHEICHDRHLWNFFPGVILFSENTFMYFLSFKHFLCKFMYIGVNLDTYFVILSKGRGPKKIELF